MKQMNFRAWIWAVALMAGLGFGSCKNKAKDTNTTTVDTSNAYNNAPVEVSPDDQLRNGVRDATKDYPGVTATVNNGEVTLTGTVERDRLPNLMQAVQQLNPKKVNNQLTVK